MTLTYTVEVKVKKEETHNVTPGPGWHMYTKEGNKRLTTNAKQLIKVAIEYKAERIGIIRFLEGIFTYIRKYRVLLDTKKYSEASDTAVRETVVYFLKEILASANIETDLINHVWNNRRAFPKKKK